MSSTRINYAIYKDQVKKYMFGKDLKLDLQKRVLEFIDYTYNGLYFNEKYVNEILSRNYKPFFVNSDLKATYFQRNCCKILQFIAVRNYYKIRFY